MQRSQALLSPSAPTSNSYALLMSSQRRRELTGFALVNKKLSDLTPDSQNANKGSQRGQHMIEESLRAYGAGRSILLDKHGTIIAGNKTAENCGAIGMEDVLVVQTDGTRLVAVQRMDLDLKDKHTKELAIADNRTAQVSLDWDIDVLKELDVDLAKFWLEDELAILLADKSPAELLTDEDDVPSVPEEPVTKLGDLYVLGNHRLMCGDSTCITDVERLMAGQKVDMVFTDPPYGVSYEGGHNKKKRDQIENDTLGGESLTDLFYDALLSAITVSYDHAAFYVWFASGKSTEVFEAFGRLPLKLRAVIQWYKVRSGLGAFMAQYIPNCEPCIYAHHSNGVPQWFGPTDEKTVWELKREGSNEYHPTQKPVALPERAITNSSLVGHKVLDLFGGSGSTLIACEKTNRKAYLMELDPKYCDVIVTRWEAATGKKAVLDGSTTQGD